MQVSTFKLGIFVILLAGGIFIGLPLISSNGGNTGDLVDPLEEFPTINDVQEAQYTGQWESENTYYTLYSQNLKHCNTYTITGELELVDGQNGLAQPGSTHTFTTKEPLAITCIINQSSIDADVPSEVLILLLDYNADEDTYRSVSRASQIAEN